VRLFTMIPLAVGAVLKWSAMLKVFLVFAGIDTVEDTSWSI